MTRVRLGQLAMAAGLAVLAVTVAYGVNLAVSSSSARLPRVALLATALTSDEDVREAFLLALRDRGWVDGRTMVLEQRLALGAAQYEEHAAELVRLQPDLIVALSTAAAAPLKQATSTIPIVFAGVADPVGAGIVSSLAHPRGNLTGTSTYVPQLAVKRLELLTQIAPHVRRLGLVWTPTDPAQAAAFGEVTAVAASFQLEVVPAEMRGPEDFDTALAHLRSQRVDALADTGGPTVSRARPLILEFAARHRVPGVWRSRVWSAEGGLLAYGPNFTDIYRRTATYVDRILRGARPGDLPIDQPTTFEFVVNRRTLADLGLTVPPHIAVQVTEWID